MGPYLGGSQPGTTGAESLPGVLHMGKGQHGPAAWCRLLQLPVMSEWHTGVGSCYPSS